MIATLLLLNGESGLAIAEQETSVASRGRAGRIGDRETRHLCRIEKFRSFVPLVSTSLTIDACTRFSPKLDRAIYSSTQSNPTKYLHTRADAIPNPQSYSSSSSLVPILILALALHNRFYDPNKPLITSVNLNQATTPSSPASPFSPSTVFHSIPVHPPPRTPFHFPSTNP